MKIMPTNVSCRPERLTMAWLRSSTGICHSHSHPWTKLIGHCMPHISDKCNSKNRTIRAWPLVVRSWTEHHNSLSDVTTTGELTDFFCHKKNCVPMVRLVQYTMRHAPALPFHHHLLSFLSSRWLTEELPVPELNSCNVGLSSQQAQCMGLLQCHPTRNHFALSCSAVLHCVAHLPTNVYLLPLQQKNKCFLSNI